MLQIQKEEQKITFQLIDYKIYNLFVGIVKIATINN